jgi:hypothetical protein
LWTVDRKVLGAPHLQSDYRPVATNMQRQPGCAGTQV